MRFGRSRSKLPLARFSEAFLRVNEDTGREYQLDLRLMSRRFHPSGFSGMVIAVPGGAASNFLAYSTKCISRKAGWRQRSATPKPRMHRRRAETLLRARLRL